MKKLLYILLIALLFVLTSCTDVLYQKDTPIKDTDNHSRIIEKNKKVLFDNAHSQTAGNADWTITGEYSDFADDLIKEGFEVSQHGDDESGKNQIDDDEKISYEKLKNYYIYIIPEPNIPFTKQEKQDMIKYVKNGGNLFLISDHEGADRNNDGWDAVEIFNGYKKYSPIHNSSTIAEEEFVGHLGFRMNFDNLYQEPITNIKSHEITKNISQIAVWNGCSYRILDEDIEELAYTDSTSEPYLITGKHGMGHFVSIGDTSVFNDGTYSDGTTGKYRGYHELDHKQLAMNIINYLYNAK
ncbi:hypothetical protein OF820_08155 [Oceanotoga sp. DSM 15011]|uniref:hypothetical protein n=1 Tax=Oceanotoga sp. DSM 15011 TaxID=2984951 RepID=UPI0021F4AE1F|nr:hypothetical protein [Oceanotoga sp. DSM 15011]UYO99047.1 hypothetical protein OF820_08155 [Oceanotoga sp. DSM 15011]